MIPAGLVLLAFVVAIGCGIGASYVARTNPGLGYNMLVAAVLAKIVIIANYLFEAFMMGTPFSLLWAGLWMFFAWQSMRRLGWI